MRFHKVLLFLIPLQLVFSNFDGREYQPTTNQTETIAVLCNAKVPSVSWDGSVREFIENYSEITYWNDRIALHGFLISKDLLDQHIKVDLKNKTIIEIAALIADKTNSQILIINGGILFQPQEETKVEQ